MTYRRRPYLNPHVGPLAAIVFTREEFVEQFELYAQQMSKSSTDLQREAARQVLEAVAGMRECARQYRERQAEPPGEIAEVGNAAMPSELADAGSVSPPWSRLTVEQVVDRLGLKARRVTGLCQPGGPLSATKVGGRWFIEEASVVAEEERRRRDRER